MDPRAGLDTEFREKNPLTLPGIEPSSPGPPDRSQTLYCLSYPGSLFRVNTAPNFTVFNATRKPVDVN
jgi:hypothetical protein